MYDQENHHTKRRELQLVRPRLVARIDLVEWGFYIGSHPPAQKWLKDRKNHELEYEGILHYQKIIVALLETDRPMKEIDKIDTQ